MNRPDRYRHGRWFLNKNGVNADDDMRTRIEQLRTIVSNQEWWWHRLWYLIKSGGDTDEDIWSMLVTLHGRRYLIKKIADVGNICSRTDRAAADNDIWPGIAQMRGKITSMPFFVNPERTNLLFFPSKEDSSYFPPFLFSFPFSSFCTFFPFLLLLFFPSASPAFRNLMISRTRLGRRRHGKQTNG